VNLDGPTGFFIGNGFYPYVAFDGTNYMVAWHGHGNGLDIFGARVSQDGAVLDPGVFTDRTVWVADSFEGVPPPDAEKYPADAGWDFAQFDCLAVSLEDVRANFDRYGLLDQQVRFLKGWFRDTLPTAPIEQLAVLRLDGDLFESTMDALSNLYPKLSVGGYAIIDDYKVSACAKAVQDYRKRHGITEKIEVIDAEGIFWRKNVASQPNDTP